MARAAVSLLRDTGRLSEFKKNAAESALDKFGAEKIVSQYEQYYQEIVNG